MSLKVKYQDLGLISYQQAWDYQEQLLRANVELKLAAGRHARPLEVPTQSHLLFCEHPHVYTLGKSGKAEHLLINEAERQARGIDFFKINRGGDITYHGPGQITGYPIFDLEKLRTDLGWYLRSLEQVMINLLARYELRGERLSGATGVWLDAQGPNPRKVCALGIRCSRWVSMHGFALNVNTKLDYFNFIVPCGIDDKAVTSLQAELGQHLNMQRVKEQLKEEFASVFGLEWEEEEV
ncbi:MAG: lipoyl(octanoyl) transferase LipB [Bacteroidetes bacterium]|nr:MAG: lipoyl(octanoyl) transferase LipB [Bacteroidota bacterium]